MEIENISFELRKDHKIYVAGHRGMVGAATVTLLKKRGFENLILRTRNELDLLDSHAVADFFAAEKPEVVILAAAKVGGINANSLYPADFLYENLAIQNNVIHSSYINGVEKLCFLGSSCIYPREAPQPIKEESLLTGPLEPTNEGYAIAKIAGYKLAYYHTTQYGMNTISLMPCNLYGRNDDFDLETCHVLSALTKRFVDAVESGAPSVTVWGTGSAKREFLNVDDMAEATLFLLENHNDPEFVNVGSGTDISIKELAEMIADAAGFTGNILWDRSKPDGMPRKLMDTSKINATGWKPHISLEQGVAMIIEDYKRKHSLV